MNTHKHAPLASRRAALDGRLIDEGLLAHTHARLIARLERGEEATWQEVVDAPLETVWTVAASSAGRFYGHLPNVHEVASISDTPGETMLYRIRRDIAGRPEERVGEILVDIQGSMICASDLDAIEPAADATLPTIYSLSLHEHPTRRNSTVIVLAGASLGVYNPWILAALGHQCSSIGRALADVSRFETRSAQSMPARRADRIAVAAATAR